VHERGVVTGQPGLYFMGLLFQFAASSDVLPGVGRDAAYVAKHIASRVPRGSEAVEGETALVAA
jgi:putative flavoprotein involved in K+ transport